MIKFMKKIITLMVAGVFIATTMTGCGSKTAAAGKASASPKASAGKGDKNDRRAFKQADLMGEVTEIAGNEVTLKLIEVPKMNGPRPSGSPPKQGDGNDTGGRMRREVKYTGETKSITLPAGVPIQSMMRGSFGGGARPDGQRPSGAGRNGDGQNRVRPSGPMPTPQMTEVPLKDVKKGSTIQIWYKEGSKDIISRIQMMPARPQNPQQNTGG
jgi:hypothetical protein